MKIRELTVTLERTERHEKYFVSKPGVALSVTLDPNDDLRDIFEEVSEDVRIMVAEMIDKEVEIHDERHGKDKS